MTRRILDKLLAPEPELFIAAGCAIILAILIPILIIFGN